MLKHTLNFRHEKLDTLSLLEASAHRCVNLLRILSSAIFCQIDSRVSLDLIFIFRFRLRVLKTLGSFSREDILNSKEFLENNQPV